MSLWLDLYILIIVCLPDQAVDVRWWMVAPTDLISHVFFHPKTHLLICHK